MRRSLSMLVPLQAVLFLCTLVCAEDSTNVSTIVQFRPVAGDTETKIFSDNINRDNATIASVPNAQQLVALFFHEANIPIPSKGFSCIIHVVRWGTDSSTNDKSVVSKSNWYVYNPQSSWTDQDLLANKRIYGVARPYILAIHLNVPSSVTQFQFAYKYTAVHRLPANIQNLLSVIDLAKNRAEREEAPSDEWAIGSLEGNPPSDITITPAIVNNGTSMNLQTANVKFDDEDLYRWDISIGIPITSYKQLQSVVDTTTGQVNTANVDKRNLLILGNLFLKPVDVKSSTFLKYPHLVGGVSLASKPLHGAMAGLGWGPVLTNFYVGAMIITDNLPNNRLAHHYKLAFGLNVPLRTMADKLGLKTQIQ